MKELFTPLSDEEYERLDEFLLERIDDDADTNQKDEGGTACADIGFYRRDELARARLRTR